MRRVLAWVCVVLLLVWVVSASYVVYCVNRATVRLMHAYRPPPKPLRNWHPPHQTDI